MEWLTYFRLFGAWLWSLQPECCGAGAGMEGSSEGRRRGSTRGWAGMGTWKRSMGLARKAVVFVLVFLLLNLYSISAYNY